MTDGRRMTSMSVMITMLAYKFMEVMSRPLPLGSRWAMHNMLHRWQALLIVRMRISQIRLGIGVTNSWPCR